MSRRTLIWVFALFRSLFFSAAILIATSTPRTCRAEIAGDLSAFALAANAWRENMDRLKTWSGEAELDLDAEGVNPDERIHIQATVTFFWNLEKSRSRYEIRITKDVTVRDGQETPRLPLEVRSGMALDSARYELIYRPDLPQRRRNVLITEKPRSMGGYSYDGFDPTYYMTYEGTPWDAYWKDLDGHAKELRGRILVANEQMLYLQDISGVRAEFVMDLARGGQLVSLTTTLKNDDAEEFSECLITWEEHNGVWVPATLRQTDTTSKPQVSRRVFELKWRRQAVNEPIDDQEFTLPMLGVRQGDLIDDARTNSKRAAEGAEFPSTTERP